VTVIDPVKFEILQHRLWAINDEAALTIARVSGSPVANEAFDFNTGLLSADGDVLLVGRYVIAHAASLDLIVKHVLREYMDNPGIGPGDMFVTNDPYVGALHQSDVVVVAPIFVEDRLRWWCGAVVHHSDVGGPVPGSVTVGASSIYDEAIPLAPVRMVEAGILRRDIEAEFLIRSRTPEQNALDLRAQIASNHVQTERLLALCGRYGTQTVVDTLDHLVRTTEERFRRRLAALPDATFRSTEYVEHDGTSDRVYPVVADLRKSGDVLDIDLSASADQAPALVNGGVGALRGSLLATILTTLAFDLPWVPAGIWPAINVTTRPGSIVDPVWPAGVSMGGSSAAAAVRIGVQAGLSRLLDRVGSDRAVASFSGSFAGQNVSGHWSDGRRFGTMLLDSMACGGGATPKHDGLDTAGPVSGPASTIPNVEVTEQHVPVLYLWRREVPDTGGPGRHRGGVGGEHAYVLHNSCGTVHCTMYAHGVEQPNSPGLHGGDPGSPHAFAIVRGGGAMVEPGDLDIAATTAEWPAPKANSELGSTDVFVQRYTGGGGYGDPIDRVPSAVSADVHAGRVSVGGAARHYHVVLDPQSLDVEEEATAARRAEELRRRRCLPSINAEDVARCEACDLPATSMLPSEDLAVGERWPLAARQPGAARFALRCWYCPRCGVRLDARVVLVDDGDASRATSSGAATRSAPRGRAVHP
jgi:N-methylhydantoinase B